MISPDSPPLRDPAGFNQERQPIGDPPNRPTFRVVIADDDRPLRAGLRRILIDDGLQVIGSAKTGRQAVEMTISLQPDVVVLNIRMPKMDGLTALSAIKSADPTTKVLMYTGYSSLDYLSEAIVNGASGFLVKDRSPTNIPAAVRAVAMGEMIVDSDLLQTILATILEKRQTKPPKDFTDASGLKDLLREYKKSARPDDSSSV
jgi:DNA-binding NarL/FixJ family response regulator